MLYILSERVSVTAIYDLKLNGYSEWNPISANAIGHFRPECDEAILLVPLHDRYEQRIMVLKEIDDLVT